MPTMTRGCGWQALSGVSPNGVLEPIRKPVVRIAPVHTVHFNMRWGLGIRVASFRASPDLSQAFSPQQF